MTLTAETYKENGYELTKSISQPLITRSVDDVIQGYILPIFPEFDADAVDVDADIMKAIYCLSYLLMLHRNVVKVKHGAKTKEVGSSTNVSQDEINILTITADMYLEKLKTKEDAEVCPVFFDVARVYNYFNLI